MSQFDGLPVTWRPCSSGFFVSHLHVCHTVRFNEACGKIYGLIFSRQQRHRNNSHVGNQQDLHITCTNTVAYSCKTIALCKQRGEQKPQFSTFYAPLGLETGRWRLKQPNTAEKSGVAWIRFHTFIVVHSTLHFQLLVSQRAAEFQFDSKCRFQVSVVECWRGF